MDLPNYDKWRLDNGEKSSPIVSHCICGCNEEIYENELVWSTLNGYIIESHFHDYIVKELEAKLIYARGD